MSNHKLQPTPFKIVACPLRQTAAPFLCRFNAPTNNSAHTKLMHLFNKCMNLAFVLLPVNHLTDDLCLIANKQQNRPSHKVMQNISTATQTHTQKESFPTSS